MQILQVVQRMGEYTPVECFFAGKDSWTKGMPKLTQQVIIGTPGTMIDVSVFAHLQAPSTHPVADVLHDAPRW